MNDYVVRFLDSARNLDAAFVIRAAPSRDALDVFLRHRFGVAPQLVDIASAEVLFGAEEVEYARHTPRVAPLPVMPLPRRRVAA